MQIYVWYRGGEWTEERELRGKKIFLDQFIHLCKIEDTYWVSLVFFLFKFPHGNRVIQRRKERERGSREIGTASLVILLRGRVIIVLCDYCALFVVVLLVW